MNKSQRYFISLAGSLFLAFGFHNTAVHADTEKEKGMPAIWKEDFSDTTLTKGSLVPDGWTVRGKPGTKPAVFSVINDDTGASPYLHIEADNASATLITKAEGIDLNTTSLLKWRWRIVELPQGADGRISAKDDQAIGIYVGTGGFGSNKSISYRWDTLTPKGSEGNASYGAGTVKVKWYTLRNSDDAKKGEWISEERDIAKDFKDAWGFCPKKVYVSVSCNSQYTGTRAAADLNWIEFVPSVDHGLAEIHDQKKSSLTISRNVSATPAQDRVIN
jgi:hypothetical protein